MQLTRLTLQNYRGHRQRTVSFSSCLTGIVGPNGSGKSNLVTAAALCLTGENLCRGVLADCVHQLAPADEKAFVELELEHRKYRMQVTRRLKPKSAGTLQIYDGDRLLETVRGDRKVTARLCDVLETNAATLNRYALVQQGTMAAFLDEQPAKRAAAFQRLFHLENMAVVHKAVSTHLGGLSQQDATEELSRLEQRQQTVQQQIQELRNYQSAYQVPADYRELQATAARTCQDWSAKQQWQQKLVACEKQLQHHRQELANITTALEEGEQGVQDVQMAMDASRQPAEQAREALQRHEWIQRAVRQREQLETTKRKLESTRAARQAPQPPADYVEPSHDRPRLEARLETAIGRCSRFTTFLDTFTDDGTAECPTCHTHVTGLEEKRAAYRRDLQELQQEVQHLRDQLQRARNYDNAYRSWTEAMQAFEHQLHQVEQQLQAVPVETLPQLDTEALRNQIREYEGYAAALQAYEPERQELIRAQSRLQGRVEQLCDQLANYREEESNLTVTQEEAAAASDAYYRRESDYKAWYNHEREIGEKEAICNECAQQISELRQQQATRKRRNEWAEKLALIRDATHRDGLPKFVVYNRLRSLQGAMNELLELFGANYRVEVDEELLFTGHFQDGRVLPADQFSGGQEVLLATSFHTAVNSTFAAEVGVLMLDEPTVYLDEDYVAAYGQVLGRLREWSAARGLQVVLITHERGLVPLFDKVEQL